MRGLLSHQLYVWAFTANVKLAPLPVWLAKAREDNQVVYRKRTVKANTDRERTLFGFASWRPSAVPQEWFQQACDQLFAKNSEQLPPLAHCRQIDETLSALVVDVDASPLSSLLKAKRRPTVQRVRHPMREVHCHMRSQARSLLPVLRST